MTYCTKCGTILVEGDTICRTCGYDSTKQDLPEPESAAAPNEKKPVEISKPNTPPIRPQAPIQPVPERMEQSGNVLSNGWKVFLTAMTLCVPLVGPILGIIMSLIYMAKPNLDSKSYGKALLILTIVYIGIGVVCCLGFMFLSMIGAISDPYIYDQFDVY